MQKIHSRIGKLRAIIISYIEKYLEKHSLRETEKDNIFKILMCRTPLLGSHTYACPECGQIREIPHSCKSRFCSVCGYVALQKWIRKRFSFFLNCEYHHVVVTIPACFRWMIKLDRNLTLNLFAKTAANTILDWAEKRGFTPGIICFFHSFGSRLQFHPHFHMLVTCGGVNEEGRWIFGGNSLPGEYFMGIFRARFIAAMKDLFRQGLLKTKAPLPKVLAIINNSYKKHWQFYTERITQHSSQTMLYCVRYAKKMILSEKRIISFDQHKVTFSTKIAEKVVTLTYSLEQFMKCILQHIPEKNFRLIRYYGFYANNAKKKYQQALKHKETLQAPILPTTWRYRQFLRDGVDPLICSLCKIPMLLVKKVFSSLAVITFDMIKSTLNLPLQQPLIWEYG